MTANMIRTAALRRPEFSFLSTIRQTPVLSHQSRLYADSSSSTTRGEPGATTNIRPSPSSSPESSSVNSSRSSDRHGVTSAGGSPDSASVATPVSNPNEASAATSEEPQPSQENFKRDPSEPDEVKRKKVEEAGNMPLDPADK